MLTTCLVLCQELDIEIKNNSFQVHRLKKFLVLQSLLLWSRVLVYFYVLGISLSFSSVQFSSVAQSCPTLCDPMNRSTPGLPVHHHLPVFTQTHIHRVSGAIQPSHPLSSPSPSAFNLSQHQGLFQWVSSSHQVAKVLEFQLQHQFFQWIQSTGLFRVGWLDLLAVQGTLKCLLQHHSSKASVLWCLAFFIAQLSHLYMSPGKTTALTSRTFVGKVMSLVI